FHRAHTVVAGHVGSIHRCLLRRKRRTFARSAKTERARTLPGEHVARLVGDGHDRIVERRLDVHHAKRDVLALLLLERLLLTFLPRRRCAGCCCGFCHKSVSSDRWSVISVACGFTDHWPLATDNWF